MNSSTKSRTAAHLLWPRFLVFPAIALLGYACMIVFWPNLSIAARAGLIALLSYAWFCLGGSFHESAHQCLFPSLRWNQWFGRAVGTFLFIPYTLYRATHLIHHSSLATPRDFELWPYSKPQTSYVFRWAFAIFDFVLGILSAPIIYGRIMFVRDSPLSAEERRSALWEYLASSVFWTGTIGLIVWLIATNRVEPNQLSGWWLAPLVLSSSWNSLRKMMEHLGLGSLDPMFATRTVKPRNLGVRFFSYFNLDINIHGPHHRLGSTKHTDLPEYLNTCLERQPESRKLLFSTYSGAIWHMLRCMVKNPGVGLVVSPDLDRDSGKKQAA